MKEEKVQKIQQILYSQRGFPANRRGIPFQKTKNTFIERNVNKKDGKYEIKKYTNDFEGSIKKLDIPYKNKRDVLKHIDPNKFPKDKQKEFQKDKNELIDAINDFLSNINEYYNNYDK